MGWFYPASVSSRADLLAMLSSDSEAFRCARRSCCGNVLWILWEPVGAAVPVADPWIGCYLMQRSGGAWGYKPMSEDCGPYYYSCPPAFLAVAPVVDPEWREGVREYWERRAAKRKRRACLHDYESGDALRPATSSEAAESRAAAEHDGGAGVILADGRRCYVEGE